MKRIFILMLIAVIVPACVFAESRGFFDFTVGVTAQSSYDIKDIEQGGLKDFSLDKLAFGADVETKISIAAADVKVLYDKPNKGVFGMVSANISIDLLSMLRVKAGIGYQYGYNFENKTFYIGNPNGYVTEFASFKDACMDVNAGVDLMLGRITLGLYATLPTTTSISNGNWAGIPKAVVESWKIAKVGCWIGYNIK